MSAQYANSQVELHHAGEMQVLHVSILLGAIFDFEGLVMVARSEAFLLF